MNRNNKFSIVAINSESKEQIIIVNWIKQKTDLPVIYIENEGKRSYVEASIVKKMGLFPGVSDLFIPRSNGTYHGLFLEVKTEKGKVSPNQSLFADKMVRELYHVAFVFGANDGINTIKSFYNIQD